MRHNEIGSVMTGDVVRAEYGTPFKEVARLPAERRISGLPVVDEHDKVLGVVSETDLMMRRAAPPDPYGAKTRKAAARRAGTAGSGRRLATPTVRGGEPP